MLRCRAEVVTLNEERCNWDVILGVFGNALKGKIIPMFSCLPTASCIEIREVNLIEHNMRNVCKMLHGWWRFRMKWIMYILHVIWYGWFATFAGVEVLLNSCHYYCRSYFYKSLIPVLYYNLCISSLNFVKK